jgi:hypothetical protein
MDNIFLASGRSNSLTESAQRHLSNLSYRENDCEFEESDNQAISLPKAGNLFSTNLAASKN